MIAVQLSLFDGKVCRICQRWCLLADFNSARDTYDKLRSDCRACQKARYQAWRDKNRERRLEHDRERRRASYYRAHEKNKEKRRAHYYANKDTYIERSRRSYYANREQKLERFRQYREQNRDRLQAWDRAYYRKNKEHMNEAGRQWRRTHREHHRTLWHAYRTRRKNAPGHHTVKEWRALREWFGNVCLRCGAHDSLTVDHVIPLSKGGSNDISNIQPLCHGCNCSKQDHVADYRDPEQLAAFLSSPHD